MSLWSRREKLHERQEHPLSALSGTPTVAFVLTLTCATLARAQTAGHAATAEAYVQSLALPDSIDRAIASGAREMIVVLPDAFTKYSGSMYSNRVLEA